jgi:hypothetical protein
MLRPPSIMGRAGSGSSHRIDFPVPDIRKSMSFRNLMDRPWLSTLSPADRREPPLIRTVPEPTRSQGYNVMPGTILSIPLLLLGRL